MDFKSPFIVVRDLISPLQCEDIIRRLRHTIPNTDQAGNPTLTLKGNKLSEVRILPIFQNIIPEIEKYYTFETKTLTPMVFEWYPTGFSGQHPRCEGSIISSKRGQKVQWKKVKDYEFTVIIFLNEFNSGIDFDERFEVRGGKLQFPTHGFSFNPRRGTTIIFPCKPNFINAVDAVELGDLNLIRFHIVTKDEYEYDMNNFPGGYKEWFGDKL